MFVEWGGSSVCVLCYLLWGFIGSLCGFSKCEFEFKVVLCRCVECSAPYQQCRQRTVCVREREKECVSLRAMCASSPKTFMARRAQRGQIGPKRTALPHKPTHTDPVTTLTDTCFVRLPSSHTHKTKQYVLSFSISSFFVHKHIH